MLAPTKRQGYFYSASKGSSPFGVPSLPKVIFSTFASAWRSNRSRSWQDFSALVNGDALLEFDISSFEPRDDAFEFLQRALERHILDVCVLVQGLIHRRKAPRWRWSRRAG